MIEDYEQKRRRQMSRTRAVVDYTMGILFLLLGVYFLVYERMDWNVFAQDPSSIDYVLAGLFLVYGCWRIYRGYKKNYFKE